MLPSSPPHDVGSHRRNLRERRAAEARGSASSAAGRAGAALRSTPAAHRAVPEPARSGAGAAPNNDHRTRLPAPGSRCEPPSAIAEDHAQSPRSVYPRRTRAGSEPPSPPPTSRSPYLEETSGCLNYRNEDALSDADPPANAVPLACPSTAMPRACPAEGAGIVMSSASRAARNAWSRMRSAFADRQGIARRCPKRGACLAKHRAPPCSDRRPPGWDRRRLDGRPDMAGPFPGCRAPPATGGRSRTGRRTSVSLSASPQEPSRTSPCRRGADLGCRRAAHTLV